MKSNPSSDSHKTLLLAKSIGGVSSTLPLDEQIKQLTEKAQLLAQEIKELREDYKALTEFSGKYHAPEGL